MAPVTSSYEVTSSIPPARLFKATILEEKHLHKILPQGVKSVEILEGDGGVGTIKLTTFVEGKISIQSDYVHKFEVFKLLTIFFLLFGKS